MSDPILVCHRGASALAPENSLEAFRLAMTYGVDFSELDVHLTHAGELVVTHDPVTDPAAQQTLPRLSQVLELVHGRMGIYVELKGPGTGKAFGTMLQTLDLSGLELIVGSFILDLVAEAHATAPDVPRSILFGANWQGRTDAMLDACRAHAVTYAHPCFRPIDASLVDTFHAAGLRVMTPHSNDPDEARHFAEIGVDVIASDDPRIVLPLRSLTSR
jgi:glycerophosphoryl diester phosphodiesterase